MFVPKALSPGILSVIHIHVLALPRLATSPKLVSRGSDYLSIVWEKYSPLEGEVNEYRIDCSVSRRRVSSLHVNGTARNTTITGLNKGTSYTVRVYVIMPDGTVGLPSDWLRTKTCAGKRKRCIELEVL